MRKLIANIITSNPSYFNETLLGKDNSSYSEWIQKPDSWGGAIEILVLSEHYETEIGVFDIQTGRSDIFGQNKNYVQRVYLLYDGIHYDPLAFTFSAELPEDMDITIFNPKDTFVFDSAEKLTKEAKAKKQFTDTSKFSLRCLICQQGIIGNKEAVDHAKQTGHQNFAEFHK